MKNRIRTNSFRNIKKSFPRFISLMVMSMLGVFAFSGLQATAPDMMDTLNSYLLEHNVYDIKIVSTLGLTEEDIDVLENMDGIQTVEGSYSKDTLTTIHDTEYVINVSSIPETLNTLDCIKGRLPEKENEIVVEQNMVKVANLKIGDTITLNDSVFKEKKVKIVGIVDSALYYNSVGTSGGRGSTSIGSGTINFYTYCLASNFDQDYFSSIYCTVKGVDSFTTGSSGYTNSVDEVMDSIDSIKEIRQDARYIDVVNSSKEEIQKQKEDAYQQLDSVKTQLDQALSKLNSAKATLDTSYPTLISSKSQLDEAKSKLDAAQKTLESTKETLEKSYATLVSAKETLDATNTKLTESKTQLDAWNSQLIQAKSTLDASQTQINGQIEQLKSQTGMSIDQIQSSYTSIMDGISSCQSILDELNHLDEYKKEAADLEAKGDLTIEEQQTLANLKATIEYLSQYDVQTVQNKLNDLNTKKQALQSAYEASIQIQQAQTALDAKISEYQQNVNQYNASMQQYETGLSQYNEKLQQYNEGYSSYLSGLSQYESGLTSYQTSYATYQSGLSSYQSGLETYESGLASYNSGLSSYNSSLSEYNSSKEEVDKKIEEANEKVNSISKPKWYVYDRTNYSTYTEYIDDTNSISNLAGIFPVVFFAVAILVSLISMNRMVEDDRLEIGTLKSLGFPNSYILSKYLVFSLLATICGGIIGALIGITYLPYMISSIYKILFDLPSLHYLPNLFTTIIGILIAIVCVCGTSIYTALKELKEKPSDLMRPKAPKNGKRILLEHSFIWKKMKFSQKIIARNIFRYKKRVTVTILGIAGCTALMLCGFGIKDSIVDIPDAQYGDIFTFNGYAYINGNTDNLSTIFQCNEIKDMSEVDAITATLDSTKITLFVGKNSKSISNIVNLKDSTTGNIDQLKSGEVIITEKIAALKNLKVGDTIELLDLNNKSYTVKISAIVDNYVDHYAFMDASTFEALGGSFECNIVYFHTKENINEDALTTKLLQNENVVNVTYISTLIEKVGNMLQSLNKVVWILIILSALLSFVVLYNLSNININERKREIATLKVLGFYDKEVDNYITKENIILTFIGILIGLILGFFLTRIVVSTIEIERCRFIYQIKGVSYIYSAIMALCFTLIVNFVTHFTLKKIDMIESLKSVE